MAPHHDCEEAMRELQAVIDDLRFIVAQMTMHIAARTAVARNIARLEALARRSLKEPR